MSGSFHIEPVLAMAYAGLLVLIAAVLERLAKRSQSRTEHYRTGGFRFHRDRDAWECPMGIALIRAEIDQETNVVRYRAPAHTCNACQIKSRCTHSDNGREIEVAIDPWVRSACMRLQRGISLVLLTLAAFILSVELIRHNHGAERIALATLLALILWRWVRLARIARSGQGTRAWPEDTLPRQRFPSFTPFPGGPRFQNDKSAETSQSARDAGFDTSPVAFEHPAPSWQDHSSQA